MRIDNIKIKKTFLIMNYTNLGTEMNFLGTLTTHLIMEKNIMFLEILKKRTLKYMMNKTMMFLKISK